MHLKLLLIFSFIILFLYFPGSYIPMVHEKEVIFFFFIFIISLLNLFILKREKKFYIPFKNRFFFFFIFIFLFFNLIFNIKKDFFNIEDYYYSIYFLISAIVLFQFLSNFNKKDTLFFIKAFSVYIFFQKILNLIQISGYCKIFPVSGRLGITGTVGNINLISFIILCGLITDFFLIKNNCSKKWKYFYLFNIFFAVFLIGYNGSRGVIVTFFTIMIIYLFNYQKKMHYILINLPLLIGLILGFRKTVINNSILQRLYIWKNCIFQLRDNLFFGTGLGNFKNAYNYYQNEVFRVEYSSFIPKDTFAMQAHNEILQLLSESGVLILPLLIFFFIKIKLKKDEHFIYFKSIFIASICFSLFDFPFHIIGISFFILIFLIFGLKKYSIAMNDKNSFFILLFTVLIIAVSFKAFLFSTKKNLSYYYLAKYITQRGSITELKKSVSLYNNSRAYYELSNYYFEKGETEKGFESIIKSINLGTEKAPVLTLARFLLKCGKIDESILYFIKGYELDPADSELALFISDLLKKNGKDEQSIEYKNIYNKIEKNKEMGGKNGFMEIFVW